MSQLRDSAPDDATPAWLPDSARRLLLVSGSSPDEWSSAAALSVADIVARHRPRTVLVNTVMGAAGPDRALHAEGRPGLGEVAAGRCRVADVAFKPEGHSFLAVPAGRSVPGIVDLSGMPPFRHLVEAAGRGGTLLLHVTETDLAGMARVPEVVRRLALEGLVLIGTRSLPRNLPPGLRVLARVAPDPPPAPPAPPAADREPTTRRSSGFSRPSRTPAIVAGEATRRRPDGRFDVWIKRAKKRVLGGGLGGGLGGVAAVWLVAVIAVWLVWQGLSGWPAFEEELVPPVESSLPVESPLPGSEVGTPEAGATDELAAGAPEAGSGQDAGAAADDSQPGAAGAATEQALPATRGVDLPYSVLVASVPYEDAVKKRDELLEAGYLAFVAPTPVTGRVYYRVFAGALEDRMQARELMRRLVASGDKERERDWDMRPTRLAFALGEFESLEDAETESRRLHESGVPAYVLPAGDSTGAIYRLYSGAFESEAAAGPAGTLLSAAGVTATLVSRRGEQQ